MSLVRNSDSDKTVSAIVRRGVVAACLAVATLLPGHASAAPAIDASFTFVPADFLFRGQALVPYMDIGGVWNGTSEVTDTTGDTFTFTLDNVGSTAAFDIVPIVRLIPTGLEYVDGSASLSLTGATCPLVTTLGSVTQVGAEITFGIVPGPPELPIEGEFDLPAGCSMTLTYGMRATLDATAGTFSVEPSWRYRTNDADTTYPNPFDGSVQQGLILQQGEMVVNKILDSTAPGAQGDPDGRLGDTKAFEVGILSSGFGGVFDLDFADILGAGFDPSTINITLISAPGLPSSGEDEEPFDAGEDAPTISGDAPVRRWDYLYPGDEVVYRVTAEIDGCADVHNEAFIQDRISEYASEPAESSLQSVAFVQQNPFLAFENGSPPDLTMDFASDPQYDTVVQFPIRNTGEGPALNVVVDSSIEAFGELEFYNPTSGAGPVGNILVLEDGWTLDISTGEFSYNGQIEGTAEVPGGELVTIEFGVRLNDGGVCPPASTFGSISWDTQYTNACGDPYGPPDGTSIWNVDNLPNLSVAKTSPVNQLGFGGSSYWEVTVDGSQLPDDGSANDAEVTVTDIIPDFVGTARIDVIPAGTTVLVEGLPYTAGDPIATGDEVTWTLDPADLPETIRIDFGPTECLGGFFVTNTADASVLGCDLDASDSHGILVDQGVEGASTEFDSDLRLLNLPFLQDGGDPEADGATGDTDGTEWTPGAPYETGLHDTNGVLSDEIGEAEPIILNAEYVFGPLANPGDPANPVWAGTSVRLHLGQLNGYDDERLVGHTDGISTTGLFVAYSFDNGASINLFPDSALSYVGSGELDIDWGFFETVPAANANGDQTDDSEIDDIEIDIFYVITIEDAGPDFDLENDPRIERVTISVQTAGAISCNADPQDTVDAVQIDLARAYLETAVQAPASVNYCEPFNVTFPIRGPFASPGPEGGTRADSVLLETDHQDIAVLNAAQDDIVDSFADSPGTVEANATGMVFVESLYGSTANPSMRWTQDPANYKYNGTGGPVTFSVPMVITPTRGSNTTISASLHYDHHQETAFHVRNPDTGIPDYDADAALPRANTFDAFTATVVAQEPDLVVSVSPQLVEVKTDRVRWLMAVTNTGVGVAPDVVLTNTLPCAFDTLPTSDPVLVPTPDASTNAVGTVQAGTCTSAGTYSYNLGDMVPGQTELIDVTASVLGVTCELNTAPNEVRVDYGCFLENAAPLIVYDPLFQISSTDLQVVFDTTQSAASLCSPGLVQVNLKSTGAGRLFNVDIEQNVGSSGAIRLFEYDAGIPGSGTFAAFGDINGPYIQVGDPVETNVGGDTIYTWTGDINSSDPLIHALGLMSAAGEGTVDTDPPNGDFIYEDVYIRYAIQPVGELQQLGDRTVTAGVEYDVACGDTLLSTSDGLTFEVPLNQPRIIVDKTGWNVTVGDDETDRSDNVFAASAVPPPGDTVVWRFAIENRGTEPAEEVLILDSILANFDTLEYCRWDNQTQLDAEQYTGCDFGFDPNTTGWVDIADTNTVILDDDTHAPDIAGESVTLYYFRGTTLAACGVNTNTAEVQWGCPLGAGDQNPQADTNPFVAGVQPPPSDANRGGVVSPITNTDTAVLDSDPVIEALDLSQTWEGLDGGVGPDTNGFITFSVRNRGAAAVLIDTVFDLAGHGYAVDTTFIPVVTGPATVNSATIDDTNPEVPVIIWNADAYLRQGEQAFVTFSVYQTGNLDDTTVLTRNHDPDVRQERDNGVQANGLDPQVLPPFVSEIDMNFEDTCGGTFLAERSDTITPRTPDLDIEMRVQTGGTTGREERVVSQIGENETFRLQIRNRNNDGSNAVASNYQFQVEIGGGWSGTVPAFAGYTCSSSDGGLLIAAGTNTLVTCVANSGTTIPINATRNFDFPLTVANESDPLTVDALVEGNVLLSDDTDTGGDYSFDTQRAKVIGVRTEKVLISTSEADFATANDVQIGEDLTYQLNVFIFGAQNDLGGSDPIPDSQGGTYEISDVDIIDTLSESDTNPPYVDHGFVSESATFETTYSPASGPAAEANTAAPAVVEPGQIIWQPGTFNNNGHFTATVVARALNVLPENVAAAEIQNTLDVNFRYMGFDYEYDAANINSNGQGFPAPVTVESTLHEPVPEIVKEVCNETQLINTLADPTATCIDDGVFADFADGDAGDRFVYRIVVTNNNGGSSASAFDGVITDTLDPSLYLVSFATDSLDNDTDGTVDSDPEGDDSGADSLTGGLTVTYNFGNTGVADLTELDSSVSHTFYYAAVTATQVTPQQQIPNTASFTVDTLLGPNGGQAAEVRPNDDPAGARTYTVTDDALIEVDPIISAKTLVWTSVGGDPITTGDTDPNVLVGEQVAYELALTLPEGTITDFEVTDALPAGMDLVDIDITVSTGATDYASVDVGSSVSCADPLTVSPNTVPTNNGTNPLTITWDFSSAGGSCIVNGGDRVVVIRYLAQVRNVDFIVDGLDLTNNAEYNHSALADPVAFVPVTVTVIEQDLALTKTVTPDQEIDAGDLITVELNIQNNGTAPAYNVRLVDILNDNGFGGSGVGDGNVDIAPALTDNLRDYVVFDCAAAITDTTATPEGFTFQVLDDGDEDTVVEDDDCAVEYVADTLAVGANVTLTFTVLVSTEVNLHIDAKQYQNNVNITGTSLPSGVAGDGDATYDRDPVNDPSAGDRYDESASDQLLVQSLPAPTKARFATSDPNTDDDLIFNIASLPTSLVAIGEEFTVRLEFFFHEGTYEQVSLQDRFTFGWDTTVVSAELARTSTDLSSSLNVGGINAAGPNVFVDVLPNLVSTQVSHAEYTVDLGTVIHSGLANDVTDPHSPAAAVESYILEVTFRVNDSRLNTGSTFSGNNARLLVDDEYTGVEDSVDSPPVYHSLYEPNLEIEKRVPGGESIVSAGQTVTFEIEVCNPFPPAGSADGGAPAYDFTVRDILPIGMRAGGISLNSIELNGITLPDADPTAGALPAFSYDAVSGVGIWDFGPNQFIDGRNLWTGDTTPKCVLISYDATVDAGVDAGLEMTNVATVTEHYSQPSGADDARPYPVVGPAQTTLTTPGILWSPDNESSVEACAGIQYEHNIDVVPGNGVGTLSFDFDSSQGMIWSVYVDLDGDGELDTDELWPPGGATPTFTSATVYVVSSVPCNAPPGWIDTTTFDATYDIPGVFNETITVTDVTRVTGADEGNLDATKEMTRDADCNGVSDDGIYLERMTLIPGQCAIYRVTYANSGVGILRDIVVYDRVPSFTTYLPGSAAFEFTPSGLTEVSIQTPTIASDLIQWNTTGDLLSAESGSVVFGVRVDND